MGESDFYLKSFPDYYEEYGNSSNFNNSSNMCEMDDLHTFGAHLTTILYSLTFVFGLLGNSLVLWILMKYENLVSLTNIFIMNLCISDLVFSCMLPFWIVYHLHGWIFGDFLCKAVNAVFSISYYSGIIFLTIMTILRYLAVVNPLSALSTQTRQRGIQVSLAIWGASMLVVVPEMIFTQAQIDLDGFRTCDYIDMHWKKIEMYQRNVFFLFSFAVIVFCYVKILQILLRTRSHRKHRTVRLIFTIVVAFFLSWAPYNIICFLQTLPAPYIFLTCEIQKNFAYAFYISRKIAFSHCCLNPVLYVFVGVKFRTHLMHLCNYLWPFNNGTISSPRIYSHGKFHYEDHSIY
ncbi:chemokine XC receptor 1 [Dermochelys coriacea]|uniref:chemokine XC receptor 1 n=1 Tax=Dermochelys coriacea TaxID=27794 RepID=UPI0018E8887E|nr:chemokine XC receptor 1 [Dermochelys coriacea]